MTSEKRFNICLCLHGVTTDPARRSAYVSYVEDVKAQVNYLKGLGYTFVTATRYKQWLDGEWEPDGPICCLMWDDARAHAELDGSPDMSEADGLQHIMPWLIETGTACSIPVITGHLHKYEPESGFASWKMLRDWVENSNGLVDLMTHTHALHDSTLMSGDETAYDVDNEPILEGPCWVDNGDAVFSRDPDNDPWYWDPRWVENAASLPLWGVDQYDGTSLITTSLTLTPKVDIPEVRLLRFRTALTTPSGSGYDIPLEVRATTDEKSVSLIQAPATGCLHGVAFQSNGDGFAVGNSGIMFYDGVRQTLRLMRSGAEGSALGVAVSPRDNALFVGWGGRILFYDKQTDTFTTIPSGVEVNLERVEFDASGKALIVGQNGVVLLFDEQTLRVTPLVSGTTRYLTSVAFNSRGEALIGGHQGCLLHYKPAGHILTVLPRTTWDYLIGIAFTGDDEAILVGTNSYAVRFHIPTRTSTPIAVPQKAELRGVVLDADGNGFIAGYVRDTVFAYNGKTGAVTEMSAPTSAVAFRAVGMSPSGEFFAVGDRGSVVRYGQEQRLVYQGTVRPKSWGSHSQWPEREWTSLYLQQPFKAKAGQKVTLEFRTLEGPKKGPLLSICVLPVYHASVPGHPAGFTDNEFYATTTCQGLRAASEGEGSLWHSYIDYPAGEKWPVVPLMILGDGTGASVSQETFKQYVREDIARSQEAIQAYSRARWTETEVWSGDWGKWNPSWRAPFSAANKQIWDPVHGYQLAGWYKNEVVWADFPVTVRSTQTVESLRFWVDNVIPVDVEGGAAWDGVWDEYQKRTYTVFFDILVSSDRQTWTRIGSTSSWQLMGGRVLDVEPTRFNAGQTLWIRLMPISSGITNPAIKEHVCVWSFMKVFALSKDNTRAAPVTSLAWPFGAYQDPIVHDGNPELGPRRNPEWHDVSNDLQDVLRENGITTAYTIQALRNYRHSGSDIGYELRLSDFVRGRLMLLGTTPLADTLNLLAAYTGALFPDTRHNGTRWQVSLEGDELGHGTVKRRIDTIDYFAFDAWAFSGSNPPRILKDVAPVNDGSRHGPSLYANERAWIQERGGKALIIINNNRGTGDPSSDQGKHVLDNADAYISEMIREVRAGGWDGITCNIEGIAVSANGGRDRVYRQKAVDFYRKLGLACQQNDLILHCTAPAKTGNPDYDWTDWVDWFDHAEIIKYVDCMKIMSYTESFEWTMPGPAAWDVAPLLYREPGHERPDPRSFWEAVIDYTAQVIPERYKRRVLLGAAAFGHVWYPNWQGDRVPAGIRRVIAEAEARGEVHPIEFWKYTDDSLVSGNKERENASMSYAEFINHCAREALPIRQNLSLDSCEMTFLDPSSEVTAWVATPLNGARSSRTAVECGFGGCGIWKIDDGDIEEYFPEIRAFGRSSPIYREI